MEMRGARGVLALCARAMEVDAGVVEDWQVEDVRAIYQGACALLAQPYNPSPRGNDYTMCIPDWLAEVGP